MIYHKGYLPWFSGKPNLLFHFALLPDFTKSANVHKWVVVVEWVPVVGEVVLTVIFIVIVAALLVVAVVVKIVEVIVALVIMAVVIVVVLDLGI